MSDRGGRGGRCSKIRRHSDRDGHRRCGACRLSRDRHLCGGWNQPHLCGVRGTYLFSLRSYDRRRLYPLDLQLLVLQGLHEAFDRCDALGNLSLARCAKRVIPIGLKFLGTFSENLFYTLAKLQFGFGPGGIAIRESVLAEIVDCNEDLLKPADPGLDFIERY